jgi:hypothetical protein
VADVNEYGVTKTTIETGSGVFFDFANPRAEDVLLDDVAMALSNSCRFNGLVLRFYSIAEHALLVRRLVKAAGRPDLGYAALHHDDEEAYLGDVVKPLKQFLGDGYSQLAARVNAAVGEAFGIDPDLFHDPALKTADRLALRIEANTLKPSRGEDQEYGLNGIVPDLPEGWSINCESPEDARILFIAAHDTEVRSR